MHPERHANLDAKRPKVGAPAIDNLIKKAWEDGWWCKKCGNGHVMAYAPDGKSMVLLPSTPSDYRGIKNARALLRKYGLKL
jgi:hypothetical protein